MFELRHLRYFIAVAEELNFSRAAERLHMAQPPLSVAIRQLEQELGVELFTRSTREVKLTAAGRTFLEGARGTLAELERSVGETRRAASGEVGHLRVAFSWGARFVTLPVIGRAFRSAYPEARLLTEEMWNSRMAGALRSGLVDIAVSLCPEMTGELAYREIRRERVVGLVTHDHPLAGKADVTLDALAGEDFVLFPRELAPRLYESILGFCRSAGFEPKILNESFHSGWELGLLAEVPVVALVPESVARELPSSLVSIEFRGGDLELATSLMWRADADSALCAAFRDVAGAAFNGRSKTMKGQA